MASVFVLRASQHVCGQLMNSCKRIFNYWTNKFVQLTINVFSDKQCRALKDSRCVPQIVIGALRGGGKPQNLVPYAEKPLVEDPNLVLLTPVATVLLCPVNGCGKQYKAAGGAAKLSIMKHLATHPSVSILPKSEILYRCRFCDLKAQYTAKYAVKELNAHAKHKHNPVVQTEAEYKETGGQLGAEFPCPKCGKPWSSKAARAVHQRQCKVQARTTLKDAVTTEKQASLPVHSSSDSGTKAVSSSFQPDSPTTQAPKQATEIKIDRKQSGAKLARKPSKTALKCSAAPIRITRSRSRNLEAELLATTAVSTQQPASPGQSDDSFHSVADALSPIPEPGGEADPLRNIDMNTLLNTPMLDPNTDSCSRAKGKKVCGISNKSSAIQNFFKPKAFSNVERSTDISCAQSTTDEIRDNTADTAMRSGHRPETNSDVLTTSELGADVSHSHTFTQHTAPALLTAVSDKSNSPPEKPDVDKFILSGTDLTLIEPNADSDCVRDSALFFTPTSNPITKSARSNAFKCTTSKADASAKYDENEVESNKALATQNTDVGGNEFIQTTVIGDTENDIVNDTEHKSPVPQSHLDSEKSWASVVKHSTADGNVDDSTLREWWSDKNVNAIFAAICKDNDRYVFLDANIWQMIFTTEFFLTRETLNGLIYPHSHTNWQKCFIPIFRDGTHWALAIANYETGCIHCYDSIYDKLPTDVKGKVAEICNVISGGNISNHFVFERSYKQNDNNSCGPAICMFAESEIIGVPPEFTNAELIEYRINKTKWIQANATEISENAENMRKRMIDEMSVATGDIAHGSTPQRGTAQSENAELELAKAPKKSRTSIAKTVHANVQHDRNAEKRTVLHENEPEFAGNKPLASYSSTCTSADMESTFNVNKLIKRSLAVKTASFAVRYPLLGHCPGMKTLADKRGYKHPDADHIVHMPFPERTSSQQGQLNRLVQLMSLEQVDAELRLVAKYELQHPVEDTTAEISSGQSVPATSNATKSSVRKEHCRKAAKWRKGKTAHKGPNHPNCLPAELKAINSSPTQKSSGKLSQQRTNNSAVTIQADESRRTSYDSTQSAHVASSAYTAKSAVHKTGKNAVKIDYHEKSKEILLKLNAVPHNNDIADIEKICDEFLGLACKDAPDAQPTRTAGESREIATQTGSDLSKNCPPRPPPKTEVKFNRKYASHIQSLYKQNKGKAIKEILGEASPHCEIPLKEVEEFFRSEFGRKEIDDDVMKTEAPTAEKLPEIDGATLIKEITVAETLAALRRMPNSAPGSDNIQYRDLLKIDPTGNVLTKIYNICLAKKQVPASWKTAKTILIYKKGDKSHIRNWRPIAIMKAIYKVYSSVLANRLSNLSYLKKMAKAQELLLSHEQAGFERFEGTVENVFKLETCIANARINKKQIHVCWLDLRNAFGSVPHDVIQFMMQHIGLPTHLCEIVKDLYTDASTTVVSNRAETKAINIGAGVKQGDPLSPMLFNIALEYLIRTVKQKHPKSGLNVHDKQLSIMAYADDLALISGDKQEMKAFLDTVSHVGNTTGLQFNAKKCATLSFQGTKCLEAKFQIQNQEMQALKEGESYEYLGSKQGIMVNQTPIETLKLMHDDTAKIANSMLAPWQKLDAIKTFIRPRLSYMARTANVNVTDLRFLDKALVENLKIICNLPKNANVDYLMADSHRGGVGMFSFTEDYYTQLITHYFRLMTSKDTETRELVTKELQSEVQNWHRKTEITNDDLSDYCNSANEYQSANAGVVGGPTSATTLSRRFRKAVKAINKLVKCEIKFTNDNVTLYACCDGKMMNIDKFRRRLAYRTLRQAITGKHYAEWEGKSSQGRWAREAPHSKDNAQFIKDGRYISHSSFKWIHKARLNLHSVNSNRLTNHDNTQLSKACRRCGYANETLAHVINHCHHSLGTLITKRHDEVQNLLVKVIKESKHHKTSEIRVNERCNVAERNLRPDIVVKNHKEKTALILDVICPFENSREKLDISRQGKLEKYEKEMEALQQQGYDVHMNAIVVGSLGFWDPKNTTSLHHIGLPEYRHSAFKRKVIESTIEYSKTIYWSHILGEKYTYMPAKFKFESEHADMGMMSSSQAV